MAKTLRVNKIAMKVSQKICRSESTLNWDLQPLIYKINTHNISGCNDQLCMYVCECRRLFYFFEKHNMYGSVESRT